MNAAPTAFERRMGRFVLVAMMALAIAIFASGDPVGGQTGMSVSPKTGICRTCECAMPAHKCWRKCDAKVCRILCADQCIHPRDKNGKFYCPRIKRTA